MCVLTHTHMITTFAEMTQLELTPAQALALESIKQIQKQLEAAKKEQAQIYADKALRVSTRLKKSESERIAYLNGQIEVYRANLETINECYNNLIKDSLRNHVLDNYTIPALKSAGLIHHLDLDNRDKSQSLHADKYYALSIASAHCRVRFSLGTYGELRDIEFDTQEDISGNRLWVSISRTWGNKCFNNLFLHKYNLSLSSSTLQSGEEGQKVLNLLSKVMQICECIDSAIPTSTGLDYIARKYDHEEIEEMKSSYKSRA